MTIYCIKLDNYQDNTYELYYHNKENAYTRLKQLFEEAKTKEEFEEDGIDSFSFFDPCYNEYSTYIDFYEIPFEKFFED